MSLVSVTKISSLLLASVAEQASLSLTWSETPEDTFSHDKAHIFLLTSSKSEDYDGNQRTSFSHTIDEQKQQYNEYGHS